MGQEERPPELERRSATTSVTAKVSGYKGLELIVDGLAFVVEGTPITVPADCTCGHGAHPGRACSGIVIGSLDVVLPSQRPRPAADLKPRQKPCSCEVYAPKHEPREIAFQVERLLSVESAGHARLARRHAVE